MVAFYSRQAFVRPHLASKVALIANMTTDIYDAILKTCRVKDHFWFFVLLNGKTTIIIMIIAYDNIVRDLYVKLLYGFLYFCILHMQIGFYSFFICFLSK